MQIIHLINIQQLNYHDIQCEDTKCKSRQKEDNEVKIRNLNRSVESCFKGERKKENVENRQETLKGQMDCFEKPLHGK